MRSSVTAEIERRFTLKCTVSIVMSERGSLPSYPEWRYGGSIPPLRILVVYRVGRLTQATAKSNLISLGICVALHPF